MRVLRLCGGIRERAMQSCKNGMTHHRESIVLPHPRFGSGQRLSVAQAPGIAEVETVSVSVA
eukprot:3701119-Prymnesium_polylepis.1